MPGRIALERIYDAAYDDDDLRALTADLAASFQARSSLIHWVHFDGSTDVLSHSGYFSDEQLGAYATQFAAKDPWIHATAGQGFSNRAMNLEELVPVERFTASEFYNEYVREMGDDTCRCLGVRLESKWGSGFVALQRGLGDRSYEQSAVDSLQDYSEHLMRMLATRGRIAEAVRKSGELAAVVNAIGEPAWLVDAQLRILQANDAAELLLHRQDILKSSGRMLTAACPSGDRLLRSAIGKVLSASPTQPGALHLADKSGGNRLELSITTVRGPTGARLALVIGSKPAIPDDSRAVRLRSLFGLTPVEASMAILLTEGLSLPEIAELRGSALGTVRVQVKQIAAKLGCSRQSEIVRIVSLLPQLLTRE